MTSYFDQLREDMQHLGSSTGITEPVQFYRELHTLVDDASTDITPESVRTTDISSVDLRTGFARRVLALAQAGIEFHSDNPRPLCDDAELRLLRTLRPENVRNNAYLSPVIVHENNIPVGLIKQLGTITCYGLRDVPKANLYAGSFHHIELPYSVKEQVSRATATAWTVSLNSGVTFTPWRHSTFVVPTAARASLAAYRENELPALTRSHQSIAATAGEYARHLSTPVVPEV